MFSDAIRNGILGSFGKNRHLESIFTVVEDPTSTDSGRTVKDLSELHPHLRSHRYRLVKSGLDRICAVGLLAAFALPGLVIAAAVAVDSDGPVFFQERRIGKGGRPFRIWKFRSMHYKSARWLSLQTLPDHGSLLKSRVEKHEKDPRITSVGGFLRKWSLDEVPQLINVLRGEMSLVGPRPVVDEEIALYGRLQDYYLAATPGMSGLWQVSGRSNLGFDKRAELDASYVRSWSLRKDLVILSRTIPVVLKRVGAR